MSRPHFGEKFMLFIFAVLSTILTSTHAAEQPGYLKDFNYQVTQLKNVGQAQALENILSKETRSRSICANRAHIWANDLARFKNAKVGKVFIHFTALGKADENGDWAYHVAPYVIVNGQEMVLDPAFDVFGGKPVKLENWTNYFGKSKNCVVLDPVNNPRHLELEKNNLAGDWMTPLEYMGGVRQYPSTEGICYIRKVPMYYHFPADVYGADLLHNGKTEYSTFEKTSFSDEDVLAACQQAMTVKFKLDHSCYDYLGIKKPQSFFQKNFL